MLKTGKKGKGVWLRRDKVVVRPELFQQRKRFDTSDRGEPVCRDIEHLQTALQNRVSRLVLNYPEAPYVFRDAREVLKTIVRNVQLFECLQWRQVFKLDNSIALQEPL
jgi:hypothetical protein